MADHFYAQLVGDIGNRTVSKTVIGAATLGATALIELRITDASLTRKQAYDFCEYLADLFAGSSSKDVLPSGGFTG